MQPQNLRLRLLSQEPINASVRLFIFEVVDECELVYSPGQFLSLHLGLEDGKAIRRSYSIANLTNKVDLIEFAITLVPNGAANGALSNLRHGDVVHATGPRGRFTFRMDNPGRHIMIGTGTGIVPYRSMLWQIEIFLQQSRDNSCIILEGVRTREDILFKEDFMRLCAYKNFHFTACLSRELPSKILDEQYERMGHAQDMFVNIQPNPNTDTIYLCGNPYMIDELRAILDEIGFSEERIITEQYFAKKTSHSEKSTPVE